ncbi:MAG: GTPase obg [Candidatus Jorgensenbacteria bacterium GW2011_GWA2_45_13]|uniref:GTPase Obg n=1 Tax=Candidatus Jorgensenbacteria bacterium GW2011_GWA2_45_13 TaxID=1618662 RepID=A0A0G1NE12_9BACT|nr:MAG: GTPase obg [Candidatus Jorgensenbacteria bacterium GW2011_GWA2_45_13]
MLIDDVNIEIKAGDGGRGAVAFQKNLGERGPTGTAGGRGGSVYFEGVSDLSRLNQFRFKKKIEAERGMDGRSQFRDGHNGKDLILQVPVGTVIHNLTAKNRDEITRVGERILMARGGKGGRGNFHFRSSTNTTPKQFEEGKRGEIFILRLELKMIADVGFVGLPNVGKSSLLNELTNAKTKVANYEFTTLEPNLGVYYELILADIPGLIEGASIGKGLGTKFLRHIERTRMLFHFVAADSPHPFEDYKTVRKELENFSLPLLEKQEYIYLSKSDTVDEKRIKAIMSEFKKKKLSITPISILDDESVKKVKELLNEIKKEK